MRWKTKGSDRVVQVAFNAGFNTMTEGVIKGVLKSKADDVIGQLMQVPEVAYALRTMFRADYPQLELEVNEDKAKQLAGNAFHPNGIVEHPWNQAIGLDNNIYVQEFSRPEKKNQDFLFWIPHWKVQRRDYVRFIMTSLAFIVGMDPLMIPSTGGMLQGNKSISQNWEPWKKDGSGRLDDGHKGGTVLRRKGNKLMTAKADTGSNLSGYVSGGVADCSCFIVLLRYMPDEDKEKVAQNQILKRNDAKYAYRKASSNLQSSSFMVMPPYGKPDDFEQVWSASEYVEDPLTHRSYWPTKSKAVESPNQHKVPKVTSIVCEYNLGEKDGG
ncbi:hypothetical protein FQA39_LY18976 [Lamprigera yunnana]|nr:hypothetical protein FQA39_LY18976 [Lamprigera yunnana]